MPLASLPTVTVIHVSITECGTCVSHPERSLQIRAAHPVGSDVLEGHRLEPGNRPPLPGLMLRPRSNAERVAELVGSYVRTELEGLGAISGCLFLV